MIAKLFILERIINCFEMLIQWRDFSLHSLEQAAAYYHKADVLIEVLEIEDCGSVGGFGNEHAINKLKNEYDPLFARFLYYNNQHMGGKPIKHLMTYFRRK